MLRMPRASLTDHVVAHVRDEVRAGRLVPGELYSVYRLSDELGVSRSPVREALLRLSEAGLVAFERNRGFRVHVPDPHDIAEIFAVRLALEVPAARRLAGRVTPAVRSELEAQRDAMRAAVVAGDEPGFSRDDRGLHALVLERSGNRRAAAVVDGLRETTRLLGASTSRSLEHVRAEHDPLVDALLAGDADAAGEAMCVHLERTGRLLAGDEAWADVVA